MRVVVVVLIAGLLLSGCGGSPECSYAGQMMSWLERSERALNDGMAHRTRPTALQQDYAAAQAVVDEMAASRPPAALSGTKIVVELAAGSVVNTFAALNGENISYALGELARAVDGVSRLRENYGCN